MKRGEEINSMSLERGNTVSYWMREQIHSVWRTLLTGPLLTLFLILLLELLSLTGLRVLSLAPILLMAVAYSAFRGGIRIGLCSAVLTIIYCFVFFVMTGYIFHYTSDDFEEVLVLLVVSPLMAVMVGSLKYRAERVSLKLAQQAHVQTLNEELEQRVRERTAQLNSAVHAEHEARLHAEAATKQLEAVLKVREQLEDALRQSGSEAQRQASELEAVFESMIDGIIVYDKYGSILRMNTAYRRLIALDDSLGYIMLTPQERGEQLMLRDEQGHLLPDEQRPVHRMLAGELLTGKNALDTIVRTLDGRDVLLSVTGSPTLDSEGCVNGGVLIFRDVTERSQLIRRTREALEALLTMAEELVLPSQESKYVLPVAATQATLVAQRLAELIRNVLACQRVCITTMNPETGALYSMAAVGLSAEQEQLWRDRRSGLQLSTQLADVLTNELLHSNEALVLDFTQPALQNRPNPFGIQTMLLVPMMVGSGLVGVLTLDDDGKYHAYTQEEIVLAKAVGRLAALVVERERLLEERAEAQANELALREANRRMDEFLGIASHEIKTPLTSIKTSIQLAQRQIMRLIHSGESVSAEELVRRMQPIQDLLERGGRQVGVQNRLVSDLLDVSRIYAGKLELRMDLCDVAAIVRRTVEDQSCTAAPRPIRLEMNVAEALVLADADRVEQVVSNYLSNALKYSEASRAVDVYLEQQGAFVRVSVRDEGPGLTCAQQQRIWQRFYRVEGVEVKSGSGVGLGLGLHICRTIIERQGGQVGVESVPGKGSTFWFTLPLVDSSVTNSIE